MLPTYVRPGPSATTELFSTKPPRVLVAGTLFYLVAPAILQLTFWLRTSLAVLAVGGAMACVPMLTAACRGPSENRGWRTPAVLGGAMAFLVGTGGLLSYSGDWRKHYAILHDLTTESWPVTYDLPSGEGVLNYTLGWYMPAGAIGRVFGWTAANIALGAWFAIGVVLVTAWAISLVGHRRAALILLVFSGLDVMGAVILPRVSGWAPAGSSSIDRWSAQWQIPSILRGLLEAPQHAMPTLLLAGLILSKRLGALPLAGQIAVLACAAVSSPFAVAAALPFAVVHLVNQRPRRGDLASVLGSLTVTAAVGLLYLTRLSGPPPGIPNEVTGGIGLAPNTVAGADLADLVVGFGLVVLLEIVALTVPLFLAYRNSPQARSLIVVSGITMLVPGLVHLGRNNDLSLRSGGLALFVLAALTAKAVLGRDGPRRVLLVTVLALGSITGLFEVRRNLTSTQIYDRYSFTSVQDTAGLIEFGDRWYPERDGVLSQYLGDANGIARVVFDQG